MRKLSIFALTALTTLTMTAAVPATAYAAVNLNTYNLPGGQGKMIVIGGGCNNSLQAPGLPMPGIPTPDAPQTPVLPETPILPGNPSPEQPDGNLNQDAYAAQVVSLVNAERAKAGLAPLSIHSGATGAAQTRAREIETLFSHTRPGGSSFDTALTAAGVTFRSAGENIAYGQRSPEEVMNSWMNSAGHRANILNAEFTSIGVGHYTNSAGVQYWAQLFLR